ncbi:helix-turn-helix domain-containing protein [Paenibacillus daejeonensis]|uniref:helix-turn-helix domain-containing protein n=1 Tax=Paenibacillus daejeonensis TaxID=135193 RepID=UPI00037496CD|nr:helix-turn-helix domain-containing protein [Paenibacillus daejeonensis]
MKKRHRLVRYSVYRSMMVSFLLLTSLIIAVVCGGLFALFSWSTAKEVGNISESMLRQNSYVAKVIKDQVYNLGNQLLNNKEVMAALVDQDRNKIKAFHAVNELRAIQANYPFIQMIGLYNPGAEQYVNTSGVTYEEESVHLSRIEASRSAYFNFIPRQVSTPATGSGTANVLTFLLLPSYYTQMPTGGIIVINIDETYIQRMIGGYKNYSTDSLFVMNEEGMVITHSDTEQFMRSVADQPYTARVLAAEAPTGYFNIHIDGKKNLVSYAKSQEMNWVFVGISQYDNLLFNMNELRWSTLGIALAIFIISLLISIWLTNHTYHPIRNLMDKIIGQMKTEKELQAVNEVELLDTTFADMSGQLSAMASAQASARRAELAHYFKGSQSAPSPALQQEWEGERLLTVLIRIDAFEQFRRANSAKLQSLMHFAICNIGEELVGMYYPCGVMVIEEGEMAMLVRLDQEKCPAQLLAQLEELQSKASSYFKLELSMGVGSVVASMDKIRESYRCAQTAHEQRFFDGTGRIYVYETAYDAETETEERAYPAKLEKKLVEAIRAGNTAKSEAEVDSLIREIERCDYQQALFYLHQLAMSLYKQFHTGTSEDGSDLLTAFFRRLPAFETLEEIGEELRVIAAQLSERQQSAASQQNSQVISEVMAYVQANYAKPDLSLEWMAGQVKLSRGYLGRLFKAQSGMSFSDYLNQVRLERAKELLLSDEPIQQISEQVGILNTTYFYTLFKKYYQVSPAQYRASLSNNLKDGAQ